MYNDLVREAKRVSVWYVRSAGYPRAGGVTWIGYFPDRSTVPLAGPGWDVRVETVGQRYAAALVEIDRLGIAPVSYSAGHASLEIDLDDGSRLICTGGAGPDFWTGLRPSYGQQIWVERKSAAQARAADRMWSAVALGAGDGR